MEKKERKRERKKEKKRKEKKRNIGKRLHNAFHLSIKYHQLAFERGCRVLCIAVFMAVETERGREMEGYIDKHKNDGNGMKMRLVL